MRKVIAILLMLGVLAMPAVGQASDWSAVVSRLAASTAYVLVQTENGEGSCTAFSINQRYHYFLTAAHCLGDHMWVDGVLAGVVWVDGGHDLLVLQANVSRPALRMGRRARTGEEIGAYGFAEGWKQAQLRIGIVSQANRVINSDSGLEYAQFAGLWMETDITLIGGQSGGPMVNAAGQVVSIVQWGNQVNGYGQPVDVIRTSTGRFWQYQ